jgi:hypothetical protein
MSTIGTTRTAPAAVTPTEIALPVAPRPRRWTRVAVLGVVGLAMLGGGLGGYLASRPAEDGLARGRAADAARWQAQAEAYLQGEGAVARGRAADAARWQAQAEAYLQHGQRSTP